MRSIRITKVLKSNTILKSSQNLKSEYLNYCTESTACLNQDPFEEYFRKNHIPVNYFQKMLLTVGSATMALVNPYRADMVACLGETTGTSALVYMLSKMESSEEGLKILRERPRINTDTIDITKLRNYPENSLGKIYANFLDQNHVTPDSRDPVRFVDDVQLAYVIQRYREIHDFVHAVLGMKINLLGEITVKWFEAVQNKLPMCFGGALFGSVNLKAEDRRNLLKFYLPWALDTGRNSEFLMNVYFEKRLDQPIEELFRELKIKPLILPK